MTDSAIPPSELLRHHTWVATLTRALARDEHDAEDLAQATWAAVLARPPAHGGNLRGFLAAVARNLWRQDRRLERRRERRHRHWAAVQPPTATVAEAASVDVVERAAAQRAVVDHVLALPEPYRSTVLLRFFDGHDVPHIAALQGVPVATVRTRLGRALQRLRLQLAGGRRRRLAPLLAPLWPARAAVPWVLSMIAMKSKLALGLGAAAVAIGLCIVSFRPDGDAPLDGATVASDSGRAAVADTPAAAAATDTAPRRQDASPSSSPAVAAAAAPSPAAAVVRGELRRCDDRPLAGAVLRFATGRGAGTTARSGADGAFAIEVSGDGEIGVDEPGWTTVLQAVVSAQAPPRSALVVAAEAMPLAGLVVDEAGAPVAAARAMVGLPDGFRARFRAVADAAVVCEFAATSGGDGRFAFAAAPRLAGAVLLVAHPSFEPARLELPTDGAAELRVVLHRPDPNDGGVQGQVVTADGLPAGGAWVAMGNQSVRAGDDGRFALAHAAGDELLAAFRGADPVRLVRPSSGWPEFVLVQLSAVRRSIRGRVVDGNGEPVAGARVWVTDPTPFGDDGRGSVVAEGLAAGGATIDELRERLRAPGAPADPEELLRSTPLAFWPWVRTDAAGAFAIEGLLDRSYDLRAMRDDTLQQQDQRSVPAGSAGVVLQLPAGATFPVLTGRVVDAAGAPVANVRVVPMCDAIQVRGSTMHAQGTAVRSDAQGRFELKEVPRDAAYLRLDGEDILPLEHGRGVAGGLAAVLGAGAADVEIAVHRRLHVQVELLDPASADTVAVLDRDGDVLPIDVFQGRGRRTTRSLPFADGRTPVFVVPDTATTLVLQRGDQEVRREPLTLVGGDVNRLRY